MLVLGIDPGSSGGLAVVKRNNTLQYYSSFKNAYSNYLEKNNRYKKEKVRKTYY